MRILITGMDGYLGWSLAQHLSSRGHEIGGIDAFLRRRWVDEMQSWSAIPIVSMKERLAALEERCGAAPQFWDCDLTHYDAVAEIVRTFEPDAVVHLGECPSAPYSMIDVHHATFVQWNNITSTFNLMFALRDYRPDAHFVKLGTMGEYGTPNLPIPEGFFEVEYRGHKDTLPFPRQPGSFYHLSKVHGSHNLMLACRIWEQRVTDVMQGVVYGLSIDGMDADERLFTRLDFDGAFGTVINRFCCSAVIGAPVTLFGLGEQTRGFLPLRDSMQCLSLILDNPPRRGEYRVLNQFQEVYSIKHLADVVTKAAGSLGIRVTVESLENPRVELERHYYQPDHQRLFDLGYRPTGNIMAEVKTMLTQLSKYRDRIEAKREALNATIRWNPFARTQESAAAD